MKLITEDRSYFSPFVKKVGCLGFAVGAAYFAPCGIYHLSYAGLTLVAPKTGILGLASKVAAWNTATMLSQSAPVIGAVVAGSSWCVSALSSAFKYKVAVDADVTYAKPAAPAA